MNDNNYKIIPMPTSSSLLSMSSCPLAECWQTLVKKKIIVAIAHLGLGLCWVTERNAD